MRKFDGTWSEVMRQLGNAVPVHFEEVIASSVTRALKEGEYEKT